MAALSLLVALLAAPTVLALGPVSVKSGIAVGPIGIDVGSGVAAGDDSGVALGPIDPGLLGPMDALGLDPIRAALGAEGVASGIGPTALQLTGSIAASPVFVLIPLPNLSFTVPIAGATREASWVPPTAFAPGSPAPSSPSAPAGLASNVEGPAAGGGLALILAIGWRLLGGAMGAVPFAGRLFSRIETPRVLDNPLRNRIHDLVGNRPGVTIAEVQLAAGVAWGTAVHHLRRLEAHGLVVSDVRDARHRYFPANTPASQHRGALSIVSQPTAQRIARLVHGQPGIAQDQVCAALGLLRPSASKHLAKLAHEGLIAVEHDGRYRRYEPTNELRTALGIMA